MAENINYFKEFCKQQTDFRNIMIENKKSDSEVENYQKFRKKPSTLSKSLDCTKKEFWK